MTVHLGARETVYLNNYDVIKEAFVKNGHLFSGRPQDLFYMKELCNCSGMEQQNNPCCVKKPKGHSNKDTGGGHVPLS